jgi:hypothetical protein
MPRLQDDKLMTNGERHGASKITRVASITFDGFVQSGLRGNRCQGPGRLLEVKMTSVPL